MINLSDAKEELNNYKGSEKKKTLFYDNKKYLVKFPDPVREKNKNISYINNAFSEYVGSNIFELIGFNAQKTLLATYSYNEKEKIVCACEDFTSSNNTLYEFESLALSLNTDKKIETELTDIIETIDSLEKSEKLKISVKENIKDKFWDMFIVDALIGNTDRHNGNWGLLLNNDTMEASFAPIYDCGSCLNPLLDEKDIVALSNTDIKNLAYNAYSCIKENGKRINYMTFIKNMCNRDCNNAIKRVFNNISLLSINNFIDGISCMESVRKEFYKNIIKYRYDIISEVYNKLSRENE